MTTCLPVFSCELKSCPIFLYNIIEIILNNLIRCFYDSSVLANILGAELLQHLVCLNLVFHRH